MRARRLLVTSCLVAVLAAGLGAQKAPPRGGLSSITPADLKEWLSYIASDQLEGRRVHTEGLGLAAAYIADHLSEWGVTPGVLGVAMIAGRSDTCTVRCAVRFTMRNARPIGAGRIRFCDGPWFA